MRAETVFLAWLKASAILYNAMVAGSPVARAAALALAPLVLYGERVASRTGLPLYTAALTLLMLAAQLG